MKTIHILTALALLVGGGLSLSFVHGQPSGIGRTDVLRHDLEQPGREIIQVRVDSPLEHHSVSTRIQE